MMLKLECGGGVKEVENLCSKTNEFLTIKGGLLSSEYSESIELVLRVKSLVDRETASCAEGVPTAQMNPIFEAVPHIDLI